MNCHQIAKRKQAHAQHRSRNPNWPWAWRGIGNHYERIQLDNSPLIPDCASLYVVGLDGKTTLIAENVAVRWTE